jgi:hypothetical protein
MTQSEDECSLAVAKECDTRKLALSTVPHIDGSVSFFLVTLHAQAIGLNIIKGHVLVTLSLDTGVHINRCTFFCATSRKYGMLDHLDTTLATPMPEWSLLDAMSILWIYGSVSLEILGTIRTPKTQPLGISRTPSTITT